MNELREQLASLAHHQWAEWMRYLFSKCDEDENGNLRIPHGYVENLRRQMETPYAELSEAERELDLKEADRVLHLVQCEVAGTYLGTRHNPGS
jgi:hypothetical protein